MMAGIMLGFALWVAVYVAAKAATTAYLRRRRRKAVEEAEAWEHLHTALDHIYFPDKDDAA